MEMWYTRGYQLRDFLEGDCECLVSHLVLSKDSGRVPEIWLMYIHSRGSAKITVKSTLFQRCRLAF
jgi:hypothetical protein